jgi:hypothetical protein
MRHGHDYCDAELKLSKTEEQLRNSNQRFQTIAKKFDAAEAENKKLKD